MGEKGGAGGGTTIFRIGGLGEKRPSVGGLGLRIGGLGEKRPSEAGLGRRKAAGGGTLITSSTTSSTIGGGVAELDGFRVGPPLTFISLKNDRFVPEVFADPELASELVLVLGVGSPFVAISNYANENYTNSKYFVRTHASQGSMSAACSFNDAVIASVLSSLICLPN